MNGADSAELASKKHSFTRGKISIENLLNDQLIDRTVI